MTPAFDEDAVVAGVDLMGRSGAREIEIGYHEDEPRPGALNWYAQATYHGAKLAGEGRTPTEAVEVLAGRVLDEAKCRRCGQQIRLSGEQTDGVCRWTRQGNRWEPGCGKPIDQSIPLESFQRGR